MKRIRIMVAGAGLLALAACNRADEAANDAALDNDMAMNETAGANDMNNMAMAPMPAADFISVAASSDMYEIEAGKLAETNGSTQAVKDFGKMLQAEHKSSTEQLKSAVSEIPTTMPVADMTAEQKDMVEALKAASGAAFDKAFIDQQVQAHQKALDMLNAYAAGGEAEPLKQFATKAGPVVQGHLEKAKSMQQ